MLTRILVSVAAFVLSPSMAANQSRVATPTFSIEGGEYSTVVIVEVRVSTPGATIRFTQNGVDPTPADPVIASGSTIAINTSLTLKARAFLHGQRPSAVRTARFSVVGATDLAASGPGDADAGGARSVIATPDGRVLEWRRSEPPEQVMGLPKIAAVAVGGSHALALTRDGRVYAWGANHAGQLGDGTHVRRKAPIAVGGLKDVARIAAGRTHSLAVTADGNVWAWGSNAHGQLGISSSGGTLVPAVVPSLVDIVGIDAGDEHSLAVSKEGRLFAWGANNHGQLGDGTSAARNTPSSLAIADVTQAAAGATHSLAITRDGHVYAWGSGNRGELGNSEKIGASLPLVIPDLQAVAVRAGRHFSAAISDDGALMTWGANDSGQLGDGTTFDRSRPAAGPHISSLGALALGERHAIAVTAAGDVWTWGADAAPSEAISDVANWGPPFLPDDLAAPLIQPSSGAYPAPTAITLSSTDEDVTLRYTVDGSDPTANSPVYSSPFVVSADTTVKVRAYSPRSGVDPSEIVSAAYQIDMSPPTIVAHVSPAPTTDWFTSPVTVTFTCADDSGSVSCPAPATVNTDGALQLISGTAIDPAGNTTTTSVTMNVDLSPPTVVLHESPVGATTSATHILVSGRVFDRASGVADGLRCNGAAVAIVNDTFECEVALHPGRNSVTLQAADVAGHVAAAGIVITRAGHSTTINISPEVRTMVIAETASVSLQDEFGAAVRDASWSSSDSAIVAISSDDPPLVTAVAPGTATITAMKDGMAAQAAITVDAAAVLAQGRVRWTLPATPGLTMEFPIFTHRVDPDVPEMFIVETTTVGEAMLRAATKDGEVLWMQHSPGVPLMGDSFGGVIAGVYHDFSWDFKALVRLGNAGGVHPWRYESRGMMPRPAQAPDGTLYAIEYVADHDSTGDEIWDKHIVVLDGRTGRLLLRRPLARETNVFTAELDGQVIRESPRLVCASSRSEQAPSTVGPIVGSDGKGYLLVRRRSIQKFDTCLEQHNRHRRIISHGIDLMILSANADPIVQPLFADECEVAAFQVSSCDAPPQLQQLVPDGIGGMLASWDRFGSFVSTNTVLLQRVVTRRDESEALADRVVHNTTWIDTVGQAGISYVFASGAWSAIDVTTWTPKWTANLGTFGPLAAHPDGGAALHDASNGVMKVVDANGQPDGEPVPFGFRQRVVQHDGDWIGVRDGKLRAVVGDFPDATRFYNSAGNAQSQISVRRPGMGVYLKSQDAVEPLPVQHVAIWIAPTNQFWMYEWYASRPGLVSHRDEFGNLMFTLGAGLPNGDDSTLNCAIPGAAPLVKGINRSGDLRKPIRAKRQMPIAIWNEKTTIERLLEQFDRYTDDAPYACFPDAYVGFYNSNSFAHSVLDYADVPHDATPPKRLTPGWNVLIPSTYFPPTR